MTKPCETCGAGIVVGGPSVCAGCASVDACAAADRAALMDGLAAAKRAAIDAAEQSTTTTMELTPYEVLLVNGSRRFYASTELASAQSELTAAMRLTDARMLTMSNDEWDAHFGRINAIRARIAELRAKLPAGGP